VKISGLETISEIENYLNKISKKKSPIIFVDYSGSLSKPVCSICGSSYQNCDGVLICKSCQRDKMINTITEGH